MRTARVQASLILAATMAWPVMAGAAQQEEMKVIRGAEVQRVPARSIDVDLRDVAPAQQWVPGMPIKEIPRRMYGKPAGNPAKRPNVGDPLLAVQEAARTTDTRAFSTPGVNIVGQGFSGVNPPDPSGAAGPNHYIQSINGSGGATFVIYSKTGSVLAGPLNMDSLGSGSCAGGAGDPVILYDRLAGRFVITEFSGSGNAMCVYVAKTADPVSGGWWAYQFTAPEFPDYPHYGVWPDAYYVGTNEGAGPAVYAFDRAKMLLGQTATMQRFSTTKMAGFGFQVLTPADLDGATAPPAGSPAIFLRHRDDEAHNSGSNNTSQDYIELFQFSVNWTTPASSTFTGPLQIPVAEFDSNLCGLTSFACVSQPGSTTKLDPLREPVMFRVAYRNFGSYQSIVGNFSTDVATDRPGVRWFELRKTTGNWAKHQEGTYAPDTTSRWMGSAAQDQNGNIAVAYNVANSTSSVYPGLRYVGRLSTDTLGTMTQGEATIVSGSAANGSNRYGDYAQLSVDPADDCTFWYTGQYNPSANWTTRIATFKFDNCGTAPSPTFSVGASPSALTLNPSSSGSSTVSVTSSNGFNAAVTLSVSGLPAGVTGTFSANPVTPAANGTVTSTLTLTNGSAAAGTYTLTVAGVNGSTSKTATISLTVNGAGGAAYDSTLKAPKCGTVGNVCDSGASLLLGRAGLGPEPNQPNTINSSCADGTSGTFHSDESNDRLKVTSVDGTDFAPGKSVRVDATVWAYSSPSSDKLDLYYAANASSPSWVLIGTLQPTAAGSQVLSATYTLPTGTLQAVRARFRYNGTAAACATGSYDDFDDLAFAVGAGSGGDTQAPSTSITAPAAGATVSGASVAVSASASDNVGVSKVDFYYGTTLIGTDTTSPYSVTWNTTGLTNGSYSLTSKATDAAGNVGTSAAVSVTVNNTSVPVTVFYNGAESTGTFVSAYANTGTQWVRVASAPYAGTYVWKAGSSTGGNYSNSGNATLTTPTLNLSGATTATLTYAFKHSTESGYDFFKVRISTNGGTSYTDLITATSGNSSGYSAWAPLKTISLNSYVGQTNVKIQFQLTTDGSVTGWGAAVDEVKVVKQ